MTQAQENIVRISGGLVPPELDPWADVRNGGASFSALNNALAKAFNKIYDDINANAERTIYAAQADPVTLPDTSSVWKDFNLLSDDGESFVDGDYEPPPTAFGVGFDIEISGGTIELRSQLRTTSAGTPETAGDGQNVKCTSERYGELLIANRKNRIIQYKSDAAATFKLRLWRIRAVKATGE